MTELAAMVETHAMESVGLTEVLLKSLLLFQRPLPGHAYNAASMTASRASLSD